MGMRWIGAMVVVVLTACGDDRASTPDAGGAAPKSVTQLIGPEGGTVELAGGGKVEIPAGALSTQVPIKVTELEPEDVTPLPYNLEAGGKPFAFEPHGTQFSQPVKVSVPFTGEPTEVRPVKADTEIDPDWQTIVGADKTVDNKLELQTTSFSVYFATRPRRNSGVITLPDGAVVEPMDGGLDSGLDAMLPEMDAGMDAMAMADAGVDAMAMADTGVDGGTFAGVAQEAYVKPSNPDTDDWFGHSVSVSGDTMVVGAPYESSAATGVNGSQANSISHYYSGAVYVYVRDGSGTWSQQAYLKASNTDEDDYFGYQVAISGDTVVVGAPYEMSAATGVNGDQTDNSAYSSGAAYVFVRDGSGTWSQQAYLKASNAEANDRFGWSVAMSGDTVVIGAPYESSAATGVNGGQADNSAAGSGAAYVFVRDGGGTWSQQAYLKASNTDAADRFGISVGISGDTILAGASNESSAATGVNGEQTDNSTSNSGAAYVFVRSGDTWSQQAYVKPSIGQAGDEFGYSVAISGDTAAIGAVSENGATAGVNGDSTDRGVAYSGAAYVFVRDGGGVWSQQAYLKADHPMGSAYFGQTVAVDGDRVVVAAPYERSDATGVPDDGYEDCGAAYLFVREGGQWQSRVHLKASNAAANHFFGWGLGISGSTIAVGAPGEGGAATGVNGDQSDQSTLNSGAAYVFR